MARKGCFLTMYVLLFPLSSLYKLWSGYARGEGQKSNSLMTKYHEQSNIFIIECHIANQYLYYKVLFKAAF